MDEPKAYHREWSKSESIKYHILMHICGSEKDGTDKPICRAAVESKTLRTGKCLLKGTHNKCFRIFSLRSKIKDIV